jgi:hypothetical protein
MVFLLTAFVVAQVGDQKVFLPIALRDTSSRLGKQITVCLREEPESLYTFGNSGYGQGQILQAIYDGPIDSNTYSYQPIIVDKIPSLQDGDITIEVVTVVQGDKIVDAEGSVVSLQPGVMIVPSGYMQPIEYSWF